MCRLFFLCFRLLLVPIHASSEQKFTCRDVRLVSLHTAGVTLVCHHVEILSASSRQGTD